jgi:hypothetical protein
LFREFWFSGDFGGRTKGFSLTFSDPAPAILDVAGTIKDRSLQMIRRALTRWISAHPDDIRHGDAKERAA